MIDMQAIVLFAHGSRDPTWRTSIDQVAKRLREHAPHNFVRCAFLEMTEPDLLTVTQELFVNKAKRITIVPMFIGIGRHVREDLPMLVAELERRFPSIEFILRRPIGEEPALINMLAKLALTPFTKN
jgi:sirohydrochlorin cobaltochelatase